MARCGMWRVMNAWATMLLDMRAAQATLYRADVRARKRVLAHAVSAIRARVAATRRLRVWHARLVHLRKARGLNAWLDHLIRAEMQRRLGEHTESVIDVIGMRWAFSTLRRDVRASRSRRRRVDAMRRGELRRGHAAWVRDHIRRKSAAAHNSVAVSMCDAFARSRALVLLAVGLGTWRRHLEVDAHDQAYLKKIRALLANKAELEAGQDQLGRDNDGLLRELGKMDRELARMRFHAIQRATNASRGQRVIFSPDWDTSPTLTPTSSAAVLNAIAAPRASASSDAVGEGDGAADLSTSQLSLNRSAPSSSRSPAWARSAPSRGSSRAHSRSATPVHGVDVTPFQLSLDYGGSSRPTTPTWLTSRYTSRTSSRPTTPNRLTLTTQERYHGTTSPRRSATPTPRRSARSATPTRRSATPTPGWRPGGAAIATSPAVLRGPRSNHSALLRAEAAMLRTAPAAYPYRPRSRAVH